MNRSIQLIVLAALSTSIAACSQAAGSVGDDPTPPATVAPDTTVPSASPVPSAVATPSPSPTPVATPSPTAPAVDPATVLAAHGIGPYVVGARLAALESQGLVANVEPSFHCD